MRNLKLIAIVCIAQVALVLVSFKTSKYTEKIKNKEVEIFKELGNENTVKDRIATKNIKGKSDGLSYNFNYPILKDIPAYNSNLFNLKVEEKVKNLHLQYGFDSFETNPCQNNGLNEYITQQFLDYKIYNSNETLLSVLFLKADYINDESFPIYSFRTLNYDMQKDTFISYENLFKSNSEATMLSLLRKHATSPLITTDCEKIQLTDFEHYKNNFVVGKETIKFYLDNCMICPDHEGEFAIELAKEHVRPLLLDGELLK